MVIIGGGFAGISAAKVFKNTEFDVLLIDKRNHHLFQPLLYQVATAALSPGDIAVPIRGIFSKDQNIKTLMAEVSDIEPDKNRVVLENGVSVEYEYLILAPGAQYNYFQNESWEKHAPGLKSLNNALDIREQILISLEKADQIDDPEKRKPYLRYVIIGGGPTGVEMAGAISEIAKRNMMRDFRQIDPDETEVYLVEAMSVILNGYPEELSKQAQEDLEEMGVKVLLDSPVSEVREDGIEIDGTFIETPNLVWAAGVKAESLIDTLECETDKMGRCKVERTLNLPGYQNLFVVGDSTFLEDQDGNPLPALAPVAMQMGTYAGEIIKNGGVSENTAPFRYVDKGMMATIGRAKAVADIKGFKFTGVFAWFLWSLVHIFFLIGFRNRFRVFAEWIWHYITFKRGVRLITERFTGKSALPDNKETG